MTNMETGRSRHSYLGIASFVLSFSPGLLLVGVYWLVLFLVSLQPAGADTVAYGFGMAVLAVLTALSELAALGLGIAGALQRQRNRMFAFLGVACGVLVLALIDSQVGLVDLARFIAAFTQTQPEVVSPGN